MSHTFLALVVADIPQETKDYIPNFWLGKFSNDKARLLIDGYNIDGELVQPDNVLAEWLQWEADPMKKANELIASSIEYTKDELLALYKDPESIWYCEPTDG